MSETAETSSQRSKRAHASSDEDTAAGATAASAAQQGSGQGVLAPFMQAYNDLQSALQASAANKDVHGQMATAYHRYAKQLQEALPVAKISTQVNDAYVKFANAWYASGSPDDVRRGIVSAYDNYLTVLQSATNSPQSTERASEAYRSFLQEIREGASVDAPQQEIERAFQDFARAIQIAWTQADLQRLDMGSIATIGQMLQAAAAMKASATATLQQQRVMVATMLPQI